MFPMCESDDHERHRFGNRRDGEDRHRRDDRRRTGEGRREFAGSGDDLDRGEGAPKSEPDQGESPALELRGSAR